MKPRGIGEVVIATECGLGSSGLADRIESRAARADVSYADPYVPAVMVKGATLKAVELTEVQLAEADCVLILTDHREFDYRKVVGDAQLVVDMRNATWGVHAPPGRVVTP